MIIYKRKKKQLVIPCGLGPVVCPDIDHNLQQKIVDSSTVLQQIEPDEGYYGLYRVIINPLTDDNLLPGNIRAGVTILGVLGTYSGEFINLQAKTVDPTLQGLVVSADIGYDGLSSVTVNPVTADIDPDILAENIKKDVEILGVTGTFDGGPLQSKEVNSSTNSQNVTPDSSYYGLSSVTVNPYTVESKSQKITQNGTYSFAPASADALSDVSISVEVAGTPATVQAKSVSYNANGEYTVTPDQGYDGLSSVDISVNVPMPAPVLQSKTVDSSTSSQSVTYDSGYDGLSSVTVNPYTLDSKTVDPSTSQITVNSSVDGLSSVTVNAVSSNIDPDIQAGNIKRGVEILGVIGTFDGGSLGTKTVNSSTSSQTVIPESSDYGLSSVTVNPYTVETNSSTLTVNGTYTFTPQNADALSSVTVDVSVDGQAINNQSKTVNSSTSTQTVNFDSGYTGLSQVTVNPYTLDSKTVDPSTVQKVINSSADGLSSVTVNAVTSSIDPDIQAGNIKRGVEILGVTGTFDGGSLGAKTVDSSTVSQTITPDSSDYGLSSVTVNPYTVETKSVTLTNNGSYTYTPTTANAFSSFNVDVSVGGSVIALQTKSITANTTFPATILPDAGYDGFSELDIDIQGVDYYINAIQSDSSVSDTSTYDVYAYVNKAIVRPIMTDAVIVDASVNQQVITPVRDAINQVTINAVDASIDSNIQAGNIKSGVTILGVHGTFQGGTLQSKTVDASSSSQTITPDSPNYGLSSVTVNAAPLQSKTVNISSSTQKITPDSPNYGLSSVTVNAPLQSKAVDASSSSQTVTPDSPNYGLSSVIVNAALLQNRTVDASVNQIQVSRTTTDYYGLRTVTINAVTSSIDSNIIAGNIKKDVVILGVTGAYEGGGAEYDEIYDALVQI